MRIPTVVIAGEESLSSLEDCWVTERNNETARSNSCNIKMGYHVGLEGCKQTCDSPLRKEKQERKGADGCWSFNWADLGDLI